LLPVGGDVVVALNEETVTAPEELVRMIRKYRPGNRITLKILRNGKFINIPVALGERPQRR